MPTIILFALTMLFSLCLDMIWLGFIAHSTYQNALGALLRKANGVMAPNWPAAIVVYLVIVMAVICFALPKANNDYVSAAFWGALLGLAIYGVYDFTNYSILANWPLNITIIDCIWGMVLCSLSTCFALFMQKWLGA